MTDPIFKIANEMASISNMDKGYLVFTVQELFTFLEKPGMLNVPNYEFVYGRADDGHQISCRGERIVVFHTNKKGTTEFCTSYRLGLMIDLIKREIRSSPEEIEGATDTGGT